jgi:C4-dicarboxylate transporter, DctM subunit
MRRRGYGAALSTGCVAAGGTLGIMIPPSIILVLYAALTEQFVITLYVAAIVPGVIAVVLMLMAIAVTVRVDSQAGPASDKASRAELTAAAIASAPAVLLAAAMVLGISFGVFTVDEAAAVGTMVTVAVAVWRKKLQRRVLMEVLATTATTTGMFYLMIIGANVLSYFVTATRLPEAVLLGIGHLNLSPPAILSLLMASFIVLGAIFDEVSVMLLTLPFSLPLIVSMGYTPVWWGIVNLVVIVIGMIAPPIGLNVFVVKSMTPDVTLRTIYTGVMPFVGAQVVLVALLIASPAVATWLPQLLGMK